MIRIRIPKIVKRLTPILSIVLRLLEGDDEDTRGGAVLVGVNGKEESMEEGNGDDKDNDDDGLDDEANGSAVVIAMKEPSVDDDASIVGPEAAPNKLTVDNPQVCGRTASFDARVNSGVLLISEVSLYSSSMRQMPPLSNSLKGND